MDIYLIFAVFTVFQKHTIWNLCKGIRFSTNYVSCLEKHQKNKHFDEIPIPHWVTRFGENRCCNAEDNNLQWFSKNVPNNVQKYCWSLLSNRTSIGNNICLKYDLFTKSRIFCVRIYWSWALSCRMMYRRKLFKLRYFLVSWLLIIVL